MGQNLQKFVENSCLMCGWDPSSGCSRFFREHTRKVGKSLFGLKYVGPQQFVQVVSGSRLKPAFKMGMFVLVWYHVDSFHKGFKLQRGV